MSELSDADKLMTEFAPIANAYQKEYAEERKWKAQSKIDSVMDKNFEYYESTEFPGLVRALESGVQPTRKAVSEELSLVLDMELLEDDDVVDDILGLFKKGAKATGKKGIKSSNVMIERESAQADQFKCLFSVVDILVKKTKDLEQKLLETEESNRILKGRLDALEKKPEQVVGNLIDLEEPMENITDYFRRVMLVDNTDDIFAMSNGEYVISPPKRYVKIRETTTLQTKPR